MPRVFKGGTSGCREDYAAPDIPIQGQPVSQSGPTYSPPPSVNFDGATSGNREDAKPPEVGFQRQPVELTQNDSGVGPGLYFTSEHSKSTHKSWNTATPGFLPKGGAPDDTAI